MKLAQKTNKFGLKTVAEIAPLSIKSGYKERIREARKHILEHYGESITPKDVARFLNISHNWLSILFRKGTGKTLIQYINEVRIEHAKKLLRETESSITEIALQVGYGNLNYFNKIFTKMEKKSPREFRKSTPK